MGKVRYTLVDYFYALDSNFDTIEEQLEEWDEEEAFEGISEIYDGNFALCIEDFAPDYDIDKMRKKLKKDRKEYETLYD